jgi:hypothetical protein
VYPAESAQTTLRFKSRSRQIGNAHAGDKSELDVRDACLSRQSASILSVSDTRMLRLHQQAGFDAQGGDNTIVASEPED